MTDFPEVPEDLPADDKRREWEKAVFDAKLKRVESIAAAETAIDTEFFKSLFAVAQGSIDRARGGADTVQKASAAIAALYTTLLGVVFSVKDNPLPSRGIIPMLFLGLAVVASTAYLAYQTRARPVEVLIPAGSPFERNVERARSFIEWTRRAAEHRGYLMKVGVVALAAGLAFLPAPFVSFKDAKPSSSSDAANGAAAATESTPTQPDWPTPSTKAGANVELQKIVYKAQVAEAAELRKTKEAPLDTGRDKAWWKAAAVVLLLTLVAPLAIDRLFARD